MKIELDIGRVDIIDRERDKLCPELIKGLEPKEPIKKCVCSIVKEIIINELAGKGVFKDSFEKDRFRESLKCE